MTPEIDGYIVRRGEATYEATRQRMVWNARTPARFPEMIVSAASESDVVAAVRLARSRGLQVAVRSGGHSWVGASLRDGTLLIDVSALRTVSIDEASRTARIGPAVTGAELAAALGERGLAFPVGHCGSVAMGGFLLSGGLGWNSIAWGPACMSVRAVEVVTPEGELVRADADRNADLLWAARGAGATFVGGVVTGFEVDLQPLPRAITTSTYLYPVSELEEVARWATDTVNEFPPTVERTVLLAPAPPGVVAEPHGRAVVVSATAFVDSPEAAAEVLAPLERCPVRDRALVRQVEEPTPFPALFRDLGGLWPEGYRYASDNVWADADFSDTLVRLRERILEAPSRRSFALAVMAPAPPEGAEFPDMAFSMEGRIFVSCYAVWEDEADDATNAAWIPSLMAELEPLAIGHYVGETDLLAASSRASGSFAQPSWERLQALRDTLDPDGLFGSYPAPPAPERAARPV